MKKLAIMAALALCACAGLQLERAVATGLDKLDAIVDPTIEQVKTACDTARSVLAETGAEEKLAATEAACAKAGDAFGRFAALQRAARVALARGDVALAESIMRQSGAVVGELLALASEIRQR